MELGGVSWLQSGSRFAITGDAASIARTYHRCPSVIRKHHRSRSQLSAWVGAWTPTEVVRYTAHTMIGKLERLPLHTLWLSDNIDRLDPFHKNP